MRSSPYRPATSLALVASLLAVVAPCLCAAAEPAPMDLHRGQSIAIIGGGIADRLQHDGWLETLIEKRCV